MTGKEAESIYDLVIGRHEGSSATYEQGMRGQVPLKGMRGQVPLMSSI